MALTVTSLVRTKALYAPEQSAELQQDLLARGARLNASYRVNLDHASDPRISGFFQETNGDIDPATGLTFLDSEGLSFLC